MKRLGLAVAVLLLVLGAVASGDTFRRGNKNAGKRRAVDSPLLFSTTGTLASPIAMASPVAGKSAWCVTGKSTPGSVDWSASSTSRGYVSFIPTDTTPYRAGPGVYFYRQSTASGSTVFLTVYNSSGATVLNQTNGIGGLNSSFRNQFHKWSLCYAPEGYTVRFDGRLGLGPFTTSVSLPARLTLGSFVGSTGSSDLGTVGDFCISGPKASIGTTAAQSVNALCGEFTDTYDSTLPCLGCITPDPAGTKVLTLGDSLTAGNGTPRPYPSKLNALLGTTWNVVNMGGGGARLNTMAGIYNTSKAGAVYVVLLGGVNNLMNVPNQTAAEAFVEWKSLADTIRADGKTLIAVLLSPWKTYSNSTTARQTETTNLNALILDYCTTNSVTCIDSQAALQDPGNPGALLPTNSGDGLHLSQVGYDALATAIRAALP